MRHLADESAGEKVFELRPNEHFVSFVETAKDGHEVKIKALIYC